MTTSDNTMLANDAAASLAASDPGKQRRLATNMLTASSRFWFVAMVIGQWVFAYYVLVFYGSSTLSGDYESWNKVLPHGYIAGDTMGNVAVGIHVFMAAIIMLGGPLQLVPQIRARFPKFHRWTGRVYMPTVIIAAVSGLYMVWSRGVAGDGRIAISINAVLIIAFALLALRFAMARQIPAHRRWALRMFLVVSGVWFFRVGLMFWIFVNGGPVGFDPKSFTGPFLDFLGYAQYVLPLLVLEGYFYAKEKAGNAGKIAMAMTLFVCTVVMSLGIFVAINGMWLPRL